MFAGAQDLWVSCLNPPCRSHPQNEHTFLCRSCGFQQLHVDWSLENWGVRPATKVWVLLWYPQGGFLADENNAQVTIPPGHAVLLNGYETVHASAGSPCVRLHFLFVMESEADRLLLPSSASTNVVRSLAQQADTLQRAREKYSGSTWLADAGRGLKQMSTEAKGRETQLKVSLLRMLQERSDSDSDSDSDNDSDGL